MDDIATVRAMIDKWDYEPLGDFNFSSQFYFYATKSVQDNVSSWKNAFPDIETEFEELLEEDDQDEESKRASLRFGKSLLSRLAESVHSRSEFSSFYGQNLVWMWSMLESSISRFIAGTINQNIEILTTKKFSKIKIRAADLAHTIEHGLGYDVARVIANESRDKFGIDRFNHALSFVGIKPINDPYVKIGISEFQRFRNCLAHYGGIADKDLIASNYNVRYNSDRYIVVDENRVKAYINFSRYFTRLILAEIQDSEIKPSELRKQFEHAVLKNKNPELSRICKAATGIEPR